jgi:polysaccharide export outer membrane protein
LDAPEQSTTLGPGDVFHLQIVGEKDLPEEYQVASDGTVDLPYLQGVQAAGLEPQELARRVRELLVERQILTDPSVVVRVKEYRSKQISVLGQVQRPGSFPFQPGMTLVQAISMAGGLNSIAARRLLLTRRSKQSNRCTPGETKPVRTARPGDRISSAAVGSTGEAPAAERLPTDSPPSGPTPRETADAPPPCTSPPFASDGGANPQHDGVAAADTKSGGTRTVVLDFDAITSGAAEDPLLQAGDRIFVEERVF